MMRGKRILEDLDEEIRNHIETATQENIDRGMSPEEARSAALRKFGSVTLAKEDARAVWTLIWLEELVQDVRFGLRTFCKSPGFTVVAILTLAIGIGGNAAVFSVMNGVLLKPLNYPHAEELVSLHQVAPGAAGLASFENGLLLSPSMYFTYAEQNRSFQSLGVWDTGTANVTGLAEPEQVRVVDVSDGVLQALGVGPEVGRWFSAVDQVPRGPARVMLSYGYWQRRFGGDRSAIGRNIQVDSRPLEIIGVMPQGFRFVDSDFDLIRPFQFDRAKLILAGFGFHGIARLRP